MIGVVLVVLVVGFVLKWLSMLVIYCGLVLICDDWCFVGCLYVVFVVVFIDVVLLMVIFMLMFFYVVSVVLYVCMRCVMFFWIVLMFGVVNDRCSDVVLMLFVKNVLLGMNMILLVIVCCSSMFDGIVLSCVYMNILFLGWWNLIVLLNLLCSVLYIVLYLCWYVVVICGRWCLSVLLVRYLVVVVCVYGVLYRLIVCFVIM